MSYFGQHKFWLTPRSLTPIQNFGSRRGSFTLMLNFISLYALTRESFIGCCPTYELTTHSSTLMMDDHTHAHTPNIQNFGSCRWSFTPMLNFISLYALTRELFIGCCPTYELTTHSSTLMMDDHTHAHTPNILMPLCICNANVIAISHVTCMMHKT